MNGEPTVLDAAEAWGWEQERTRQLSTADVRFMMSSVLGNFGIPADFLAADLPKAIAMWQRAQQLVVGTPEDHDCVPGNEWDEGWFVARRNLLAYLRGES